MEIFVSLDLILLNSMQKDIGCFILNYSKELDKIGTSIYKELKDFYKKYQKILVLNNQKVIEINLLPDTSLSISVTKRIINLNLFNRINKDEVELLIKNRIIFILEKDNVFVPDYIKEEVNGFFSLDKKIKNNMQETKVIIDEINKG